MAIGFISGSSGVEIYVQESLPSNTPDPSPDGSGALAFITERFGESRWGKQPFNEQLYNGGAGEGVLVTGGFETGIYGYDLEYGQELWSDELNGGSLESDPVIYNGLVAYDANDNSGTDIGFVLDVNSGTEEWTTTYNSTRGWGVDSVNDIFIHVEGFGGPVTAFDASSTKNQLWSNNTKPDRINDAPFVVDSAALFPDSDQQWFVLDSTTGDFLYDVNKQNFNDGVATHNEDKFIYNDGNNAIALDATSGSELYTVNTGFSNPSTLQIYNDIAISVSGFGAYYAFDATDGTELWQLGSLEPSETISGKNVLAVGTDFVALLRSNGIIEVVEPNNGTRSEIDIFTTEFATEALSVFFAENNGFVLTGYDGEIFATDIVDGVKEYASSGSEWLEVVSK